MVILLNGWILPFDEVASGRICSCSLRSMLVFIIHQSITGWMLISKNWNLPILQCDADRQTHKLTHKTGELSLNCLALPILSSFRPNVRISKKSWKSKYSAYPQMFCSIFFNWLELVADPQWSKWSMISKRIADKSIAAFDKTPPPRGFTAACWNRSSFPGTMCKTFIGNQPQLFVLLTCLAVVLT